MELCLDGTQTFELKDLVKKILNDQDEFNLQYYIKDVLKQSTVIQSNILIILALLFIENTNLQRLSCINFSGCTLYDVDLMYTLTYF